MVITRSQRHLESKSKSQSKRKLSSHTSQRASKRQCVLAAANTSHLRGWVHPSGSVVQLPLQLRREEFSLAQAICSYGYFRLPPNQWIPSLDGDEDHGVFGRPLRYGTDGLMERSIEVKVGQSVGEDGLVSLWLFLPEKMEVAHEKQLVEQVYRIVRKDFDLKRFHEKHEEAKARGFGRTFRSPTLFEDMIKTLTNCNVTWKRTMQMNHLLCKHVGHGSAFPTAHELAEFDPAVLKDRCKVGYRASWMVRLAQQVVSKEVNVDWMEHSARTHEELFPELLKIKGFAKFACYNVLQLLGHHDAFPFDTETVRLLKEKHGIVAPSKEALFGKAKRMYDTYEPYQFLAYWFDLWNNYEARAGSVSTFWQCDKEDYM